MTTLVTVQKMKAAPIKSEFRVGQVVGHGVVMVDLDIVTLLW
jgi:hypothetical protein